MNSTRRDQLATTRGTPSVGAGLVLAIMRAYEDGHLKQKYVKDIVR